MKPKGTHLKLKIIPEIKTQPDLLMKMERGQNRTVKTQILILEIIKRDMRIPKKGKDDHEKWYRFCSSKGCSFHKFIPIRMPNVI